MIKQRTDAWLVQRLGHVTASRISDALDMLKNNNEGQKRINYRLELIAERLTGQQAEFFENNAMKHGVMYEPLARRAYEALTGNFVEEVGFIKHPTLEWSGASPDGLIGNDGLIEIKCPTSQTYIAWMLAQKVPEKHKDQMLWQLVCTGRKWCDFVSFDPRMPEELSIFVNRYEPTIEEKESIELQAKVFLNSIDEMIEKLFKLNITG